MTDGADAAAGRESDALHTRCPECNAEYTYDAAVGRLVCPHCGSSVEAAEPARSENIVEYDLEAGLARSARRGMGAPVLTTTCSECGARVNFPDHVTATRCDFCDSAQVLSQEENRTLIRPESMVPFLVDGKDAARRFRAWLGNLWFRPSDLAARSRVTEMNGVYVPYWTFNAQVDSTWTAQAGDYYHVTEEYTDTDDEGRRVTRTREVRKTRWRAATGSRHDRFKDLLVCASRGLPEEMARKLDGFDTDDLEAYDPAYLAGWKAEEYAIDLNEAWKQAVGRIEQAQRDHCAGDIPGDTHRRLSVCNRFSGETFKHVLLPVWISSFRYNGEVYRFLVNGQTGEVLGKAPWSVAKLTALCLSLAGLLTLIILLWRHFS